MTTTEPPGPPAMGDKANPVEVVAQLGGERLTKLMIDPGAVLDTPAGVFVPLTLEQVAHLIRELETVVGFHRRTPPPGSTNPDTTKVPFKLTPTTLAVLRFLADGSARYGYEVAEATGKATGTINTILNRMLAHGWVRNSWDTTMDRPGPRRRYFWIDQERQGAVQALLAARDQGRS
jgi:PadR family transcriptional regulator PadR